jgi:hypothetical protein
MRWDLRFDVPGDAFLAEVPNETETPLPALSARATLYQEEGEDPARLAVSSSGAALPAEQGQANSIAESVARQIGETDAWVAVVEMADIRLRGTSTELHCSIAIDEADLQGRDENFRDGVRTVANQIVTTALNSLGVPGTPTISEEAD